MNSLFLYQQNNNVWQLEDCIISPKATFKQVLTVNLPLKISSFFPAEYLRFNNLFDGGSSFPEI
jgi:hypothetical protein